MALVLPILRIWLLLLNVYGTFKAMKPPSAPRRPARNGQGPSSRALQLRKRELKSRLALWIVWALFCILEGPVDNSIGYLTPFYNEIKCGVLIFLLVSRAHGAEAIFLHLIHPFLRPYAPVIDEILSTLASLAELVVLILLLPWEYLTHWWNKCKLAWKTRRSGADLDGHNIVRSDTSGQPGEERIEPIATRLRPRNNPQREQLVEAHKQAQPILEDIDEAQGRVRNRTRGLNVRATQAPPDPAGGTEVTGAQIVAKGTAPLRVRKRLLEQTNTTTSNINLPAGSKSTSVHQLDPADIVELPRSSTTQQLLIYSASRPASPTRGDSAANSKAPKHLGHQIWYPPLSSFKEDQPVRSPPRSPSPVYPPLPAAYPFTPQKPTTTFHQEFPNVGRSRSESRVVGRGATYELIDPSEFREEQQAGPSIRRASMSPESRASENLVLEDFFQVAPDPFIQPSPMDVDMEEPLAGSGSSAKRKSMDENELAGSGKSETIGSTDADAMPPLRRAKRNVRRVEPEIAKGKARATIPDTPLRRSTRKRDGPTTMERDAFGFTIRHNDDLESLLSNSTTTDSSSTVTQATITSPSRQKKPLARTKPALKVTQEEDDTLSDSSDENVKKKRKVNAPGKFVSAERDKITAGRNAKASPKEADQAARGPLKKVAASVRDERNSFPKSTRISKRTRGQAGVKVK